MYDLYSKVGKYLKADKKNRPSLDIARMSPGRSISQQSVDPGSSRTYAGQPDPTQPAGVVHGQEGVMSARAMQNLGNDTFTALSHKAEDGTIDLNMVRNAVGMAPMPGYASGGVVTPSIDASAGTNSDPSSLYANWLKSGKTSVGGVSLLPPQGQDAQPAHLLSYADDPANQTVGTPIGPQTVIDGIVQSQPLVGGGVSSPAPQVRTLSPAPQAPANTNVLPLPSTTAGTETAGSVASNPEDQTRTASNQYLTDVMNNNNPLQKNIASQTLGDLAARQQYSNAALGQTEAQNPNLTEGGKATLTAEQLASQNAETAKTEGTLAVNAQNQAIGAAGTLYSGSLAGQSLELSQNTTAYNAAVAAGDYNAAAAAYKTLTGQTLDPAQFKYDQSNKNLGTLMTTISDFVQSGVKVQDALQQAENSGLVNANDPQAVTNFTNNYNAIEANTNPLTKSQTAVKGMSDEVVNAYFASNPTLAALTPAQKRDLLTNIVAYGITPTVAPIVNPGEQASSAITFDPGAVTQHGSAYAFSTNPPPVGQYVNINGHAYQVQTGITPSENFGTSSSYQVVDPTNNKPYIVVAGYGLVSPTATSANTVPIGNALDKN